MTQIAEHLHVIHTPTYAERNAAIVRDGHDIHVVLTNGSVSLTGAETAAMPKLGLAYVLSVGYENIDVGAAHARGMAMANDAGTNDACMADHAFGLLLATVHGIPKLDRSTRNGVWRDDTPLQLGMCGKCLGIVGPGTIGTQIARRAAGFDMQTAYHSHKSREGVSYRYFNALKDMADWVDFLIVATPGGAQTKHLVNQTIPEVPGPNGCAASIARGSVVDTIALEAAIRSGKLGGVGLGVYENEPRSPAGLLDLKQVVLTPCITGWPSGSVQATMDRFLENTRGYLAGTGAAFSVK